MKEDHDHSLNPLTAYGPAHRYRKRSAKVLDKIEALSKLPKIPSVDMAANQVRTDMRSRNYRSRHAQFFGLQYRYSFTNVTT